MNVQNQIVRGVIWKQLMVFFVPIVVGTLFQQLYNTVDAVIVGRFVGKEALACVGGSAAMVTNLVLGFLQEFLRGQRLLSPNSMGQGSTNGYFRVYGYVWECRWCYVGV